VAVQLYGQAFLFDGKAGTGKTAMAIAFTAVISAHVHLLPPRERTRVNMTNWRPVSQIPEQDTW
jgi:MoxR-like ATPase